MFKSKVFEIGDRVFLKEDLSQDLIIKKLYTEYRSGFCGTTVSDEKVVLNNDKVYDLEKIVPYTYQVKKLATENKELRAMIVKNVERFNALEKKINEKVFKPKTNIWDCWYGISIASLITDKVSETPEAKKEPTLEERIANLEAKKEKKVSKKKNNKSKK